MNKKSKINHRKFIAYRNKMGWKPSVCDDCQYANWLTPDGYLRCEHPKVKKSGKIETVAVIASGNRLVGCKGKKKV